MTKTSMTEALTNVRADGVGMTELLSPVSTGSRRTMGHASFPNGTVVPWAAHDCDEYSYILEGELICETKEDGLCRFSAGSACFIPAGQAHSTRNESGSAAQVLWVLLEK